MLFKSTNKFFHKIFRKILFIIFVFIFTSTASAFSIVGTWDLVSITQKNQRKNVQVQCYSPTGLLIYTAGGFMSVGVNCMNAKNSQVPSYKIRDMTFYTGKYSLTGNEMIHHTFNAISSGYYDITLVRKLRVLNDNEIILIVNTKEGKEVQLKWRRISNI